MFVSVIIPVYNDCERLKLCLAALRDQSFPEEHYEIIIVDNGRNEGIREAGARYRCRLLVNERNTGDAARNKGIAAAQGDILAFTDSDCIPARDWIAMGVRRLFDAPNCGSLAGRITWHFRDPERPAAVEWYDSVTNLQQRTVIERYGFGVTANLFTRKAVIDRTGWFDDSLPYLSDFEWGMRVQYHGYASVYADDVVVSHAARTSLWQLCRRAANHGDAFYRLSKRKEEWLAPYIRRYRNTRAVVMLKRFLEEICTTLAVAGPKPLSHRIQFILIHIFIKSVEALKLGRILYERDADRDKQRS